MSWQIRGFKTFSELGVYRSSHSFFVSEKLSTRNHHLDSGGSQQLLADCDLGVSRPLLGPNVAVIPIGEPCFLLGFWRLLVYSWSGKLRAAFLKHEVYATEKRNESVADVIEKLSGKTRNNDLSLRGDLTTIVYWFLAGADLSIHRGNARHAILSQVNRHGFTRKVTSRPRPRIKFLNVVYFFFT